MADSEPKVLDVSDSESVVDTVNETTNSTANPPTTDKPTTSPIRESSAPTTANINDNNDDDDDDVLDLTAEELDFINDFEVDLTKEDRRKDKQKNIPGSSLENSIPLDDDTFAFFVEAGLDDADELKMLGIDYEEIKAQKRLAETLEQVNRRDHDLAQQLQSQFDSENNKNNNSTAPTASSSNSPLPSSSSSTQTSVDHKGKRKLDAVHDDLKRVKLNDPKGKSPSEPMDLDDYADVIDLTAENENDYVYIEDGAEVYSLDDDDDDVDLEIPDYLSSVPWNHERFRRPYSHVPSQDGSAGPSMPGSSSGNIFNDPLLMNAARYFGLNTGHGKAGSSHMSSVQEEIIQNFNNRASGYLSPEQAEKELRELLENIQYDEAPAPEERAGTPEGLSINLLEHQKIGLQWMMKMENSNNKGGILADDMGLGKTIQAMAVMVQNPCTNPTPVDHDTIGRRTKVRPGEELNLKTTLIVCPVSLMDQWRREIEEKTSPRLKTLVYHGSQRTLNPYDFAKYDVIISSYAVASSNFREQYKGPMSMVKFHRVILDEAHTIKNRATIAARGCCEIDATYRWCLTATPIQNKVEELYSLIRFLRIRPFCEWNEFRDTILKPMRNGYNKKAIKVASVLMKAISFRRSKKAMIDGRPILNLPERNVHMTHIDFTPDERMHYDYVDRKAQARFNKYMQQGTVMKHYSSVLVLLLRLRQSCLHPSLTLTEGDSDVPQPEDPEKQLEVAKNMNPDVVRRLLSANATLSDIECPICMDIAQDAQILKTCGHILCKECTDSYINANDGTPKRCPQCRGDMNRQNLITLEAFTKVHAPQLLEDLKKEQEEDQKEKEALERVREFVSSSKIDKMLNILEETRDSTGGKDKTIVFSQFTAFLDLLSAPLKAKGFKYLRYDGSMDIKQRAETITTFHESSEYNVLLVSTKCGSLGLNLTCANRVILMDIWWNPALENQAIDRVHRIGQTKPVEVHRIFINDTVEDRILELQKKKQSIADGVLGEGSGNEISRLGLQEMIYLFRGGNVPEPSANRNQEAENE